MSKTIVKAFEVRAKKKFLVCNLSQDLNSLLNNLQYEGWRIINVVSTPCVKYSCKDGYFDSTLFTIIAEFTKKEEIKNV